MGIRTTQRFRPALSANPSSRVKQIQPLQKAVVKRIFVNESQYVSDDATVDEHRGLIYRMLLKMTKNTIWVEGKEVKLQPGMAVTAEVQTGARRLIDFFLSPLLRYQQESFGER